MTNQAHLRPSTYYVALNPTAEMEVCYGVDRWVGVPLLWRARRTTRLVIEQVRHNVCNTVLRSR